MGDEYEELGPAQAAPPPPAPATKDGGAPAVPPPPPPPNTVPPPPPPPPPSGSVQKQLGRDERTELESEKGEPPPAPGDVKGQGSNFSPFTGGNSKQVIVEEESDNENGFTTAQRTCIVISGICTAVFLLIAGFSLFLATRGSGFY